MNSAPSRCGSANQANHGGRPEGRPDRYYGRDKTGEELPDWVAPKTSGRHGIGKEDKLYLDPQDWVRTW
jgi:hypothetical protein